MTRAPLPATSYEHACDQFAALLERDTPDVDPRSRARLITPGHRTERVVVFLHGLSNSPQQFEMLAERFVARGYAVFIPRVPYHGYLDRMSTDHGQLTLDDLIDVTASSIDLASGLGDEVTVSGISLGGVLAAWAAQYRPVALAAPIAPAIGVPLLPYPTTAPVFNAMGRLPNRFIWWDPRKRENLPGPIYAYPRFATRALAATQRLGQLLLEAARHQRPAAQHILMISNAADFAVSNSANDTLVRRWRATGSPDVRAYRFPKQLKLFHDIVDPHQPYEKVELTHPLLERMLIDGLTPTDQDFAPHSAR